MERDITFYQNCIKDVLRRYQTLTTEHTHVECIFDDERQSYMALRVGWAKYKRIHLCLVHIDLCDDTVLIQCNNTEDLIATELAEMGIPREKIRLGFVPEDAGVIPETPSNQALSSHFAAKQPLAA